MLIIQTITFWRSSKIKQRQKQNKKYGILIFVLTQDHIQLEIQSAIYISPTIFIVVHPNFMRRLVTMVNLNAS